MADSGLVMADHLLAYMGRMMNLARVAIGRHNATVTGATPSSTARRSSSGSGQGATSVRGDDLSVLAAVLGDLCVVAKFHREMAHAGISRITAHRRGPRQGCHLAKGPITTATLHGRSRQRQT